MMYLEARQQICRIVESMFDRFTTNAAGANLSAKVDEDRYVMTASKLSSRKLWVIDPDDVIVVDGELNVLEGVGKPTREINMHMAMYAADANLGAVIHAHPRDSMVYATLGHDMPLVCENVEYLGESMVCLPYQIATTKQLANEVGAWTKKFSATFSRQSLAGEDIYAYGALLRRHGVIVGGESLFDANDMLERLETNAYVATHAAILQQQGLEYSR